MSQRNILGMPNNAVPVPVVVVSTRMRLVWCVNAFVPKIIAGEMMEVVGVDGERCIGLPMTRVCGVWNANAASSDAAKARMMEDKKCFIINTQLLCFICFLFFFWPLRFADADE